MFKEEKGKNLDYGHIKSDSREGQMVRRAALTMAKDLMTLYKSLSPEDDLPQWCHYKIANAKKDLGDVSDYISSKIVDICLNKDISQSELRLEIREVFNDKLIK
tara:strand:- start:3 stop:314 length:312 start_codon:yes stop_codon:yes gene_type:complete